MSAAMPHHLLVLLLLSVCSLVAAPHKIPALIVFGDSTVDAGNNNQISTVLKSNFHPYGRDFIGGLPTGRFCNGRLPTDFISEALGLHPIVPAYLDPAYSIRDFARGVCFASAGTGLDNATSDVLQRTASKEKDAVDDAGRERRGDGGEEAVRKQGKKRRWLGLYGVEKETEKKKEAEVDGCNDELRSRDQRVDEDGDEVDGDGEE